MLDVQLGIQAARSFVGAISKKAKLCCFNFTYFNAEQEYLGASPKPQM